MILLSAFTIFYRRSSAFIGVDLYLSNLLRDSMNSTMRDENSVSTR